MSAKHLLSCHHCMLIHEPNTRHCSFCHSTLHKPEPLNLQRSWVFLLTALLLYFPANLLPIMLTNSLGTQTSNTIAGGVLLLWDHGSYFIAGIIFIASLLVPIAKFVALFALCLSETFDLRLDAYSKTAIYRMTEYVGRWSMIDVFVVAFLAGFIQMGEIMSIYPGPAALAFAAMVIFTMLAANSINPKQFWDKHDE